MMIKLEKTVNFNLNVKAINLPTLDMNDDFLKSINKAPNKMFTVAGWGSTIQLNQKQVEDFENSPKNYPDVLQYVDLFYLPKAICQRRYKRFFAKHEETKHLNMDEKDSSMLCASVCASETLAGCKHQPFVKSGKGVCSGDSGCE